MTLTITILIIIFIIVYLFGTFSHNNESEYHRLINKFLNRNKNIKK